jgi:hypothetical protein
LPWQADLCAIFPSTNFFRAFLPAYASSYQQAMCHFNLATRVKTAVKA